MNERYGAGHAAEEIYEVGCLSFLELTDQQCDAEMHSLFVLDPQLFNPLVHRTPISDAILEDVQCPGGCSCYHCDAHRHAMC